MDKITIEDTGAGFYINFNIPEDYENTNIEDTILENVYLEINNEKPAAGCLLFINDGKIDFLEIYTYIGDWPNSITDIKVYIDE